MDLKLNILIIGGKGMREASIISERQKKCMLQIMGYVLQMFFHI